MFDFCRFRWQLFSERCLEPRVFKRVPEPARGRCILAAGLTCVVLFSCDEILVCLMQSSVSRFICFILTDVVVTQLLVLQCAYEYSVKQSAVLSLTNNF